MTADDTAGVRAAGERVAELDRAIFYVFQAADGAHWFGSNERGVYRFDGEGLVNFTTRDGLVSDRIRGIQEDGAGNVYFTTYEGISRFDGEGFTTLPSTPSSEWKRESDDLWFVGPPDTGTVYRYDGETLAQLTLPKSRIGEEVAARYPRAEFPNAIFSPYDVYTITRDRSGNLWFGTAAAGACRFDGQSFRWLYEDHLTNLEGGGSFGIRAVLEDRSGALWICNTRHRFRLGADGAPEPEEGHLPYRCEPGIELTAPDGQDRVYFMSAVEDAQGALWFASIRFGVWRYQEGVLTRFPVLDGDREITLFSISLDRRGDLWLGTHEAGAYRFDGAAFERFQP
jgi:ligand-binding sensor domain-containing protein